LSDTSQAPDAPQPDPEALAAIRRLLGVPDPERQAHAINVALGCAVDAATGAWRDAEGLPPRERLLVVLEAICQAMEGLGLALEEEGERERG
jgi:hypothetical protein